MNSRKFKLLIISLMLLAMELSAGLPSFFPTSSSKVISLNGIYAAGTDGISSLTSNPAGLASLKGGGIEASIYGRLGQSDYINGSGTLFRSFRDDDIGLNVGAYWNVLDNFTLGIDYNNAYQYRVNWPFARFIQGDSSSSVLAFDHLNDYSIQSINPAAAMNFGSFSLGISVNILNIQHTLGLYQGDPNWEQTVAAIAGYQVKTEEDAWAFGGTIGVQGKISSNLKFGLFIKSSIKASLEGTSKSSLFSQVDSTDSETAVSSDFEIPWKFGAGIIYDISENLKLNVDLIYNLWGSTQETQTYKYGNSIWTNRFSSVDSLSGYTGSEFTLKYNNSLDLGFGLEYDPKANIVLRFGYRFSQTNNSDNTYSMLYPSVDQHWLSGGIGFWFEELYIDLAVAYGFSVERTVPANENFFYSGKYSGDAYIPSLNIKYQF